MVETVAVLATIEDPTMVEKPISEPMLMLEMVADDAVMLDPIMVEKRSCALTFMVEAVTVLATTSRRAMSLV